MLLAFSSILFPIAALIFSKWANCFFLLFNFDKTKDLSFLTTIKTFLYGIQLDFAFAAYLCFIPFLLIILTVFFKSKNIGKFIKWYSFLLIITINLLLLIDAGLYQSWGVRLDTSILPYLNTPELMIASVSSFQLISGTLFWILVSFVFIKIFKSIINSKIEKTVISHWLQAPILLLITAMYWIAWKFIQHRGFVSRLDLSEEKTFALFGFVLIIQTALMAICFRLADFTSLQNVSAPFNDPTLWSLAIPFAFSSLLMTLLADRRTALFTGIFSSMLAGLLAPTGLEFALYSFITSAVAVYGIGHYRSRQSVTIAGAMVGGASALTAVALLAYTQQPLILNTILLAIGCGLVSGLITSAATAVFLPLCETFFGIMTDVKLLELSNADLPILGRLALQAPGTNQHSHAVGQLAEEACRKVGANGLLSRIGALYHDIGKTAAPEHFVENQRHGNPHDGLKPAQSAKIIISHVTYGTQLAKEMGLPARIVDFIPQHHGTRTLHYFLSRAKEEAGKGEEIDENDFRYPGPKPQFKESAIMMIADSCEAAARSLSEPTPENIRFIVTKIIDAILSDDQLDECDLTLRELTQIRESMIKSLISIYHSRVEYPGYTPPSKSLLNIVIPKDLDENERGTRYKNPADIPISRGGEVEDEALHRAGHDSDDDNKDEKNSDAKTDE